MPDIVIARDDPRRHDVCLLLEAHLSFAHETSPADHVHALDVERLVEPGVSFFSARRDGTLLGVGALREIEAGHGEIKSMHTTASARGMGVGRAMLGHLLGEAESRGYRRVSLETGTMEAFAPARALYQSAGFRICPPFAEYTVNPFSVCMTLELGGTGIA